MATRRAVAGLAWLVQVEEEYGTRRLVATVVRPQADGELHNTMWEWSDSGRGREYADLQVTCYLGEINHTYGTSGGNLWGLGYCFAPHPIESADQARSIAAVFDRIRRGLHKAEEDAGYIKDGDYAAYLLRIAAALRIRDIYVRNHRQQREMTGERFRKANGSLLQWWVSETSRLAEKSPADLKG